MRHGSLFSGIGGFDLAAQWMGWENIFHCEINPFCQRVLSYHFPNSIQHHDITKTDFTVYRGKLDILTGGFPCQPFSVAGKQLGTEDDRHLWPEMLRAISETQPSWIVGENVRGLVNWSGGLVFEQVQADLEAQGYEVIPFILPACAVDAPHRRDRVWFVAYSNIIRLERRVYQEGREREAPTFNASTFHSLQLWKGWQNFPTQSPICSGDDGLPDRLDAITFSKWRQESIKAYGNAVVPPLVLEIFKAIEAHG